MTALDDTSQDVIRRFAQALHDRVGELEALFDLLPVGLAIADDPLCSHVRINRALAAMLRVPPDANMSMSSPGRRPALRAFKDGSPLAPGDLPMQRAAREGRPVEAFDFDVVTDDGHRAVLHMGAVPLFDGEGRVRGVVGAAVDISQRIHVEREQRLLAEASRVLSSSLDYDMTLNALPPMVVPALGDYCFVDIVRPDGTLSRIGYVAGDADKRQLAAALQRFPPIPGSQSPAAEALRTGEPVLMTAPDDGVIARTAQSEEHARLLHAFAARSCMMAPLVSRDRILGLLTFGTFHGRVLEPHDLDLAVQVAARAALALDNALLYTHAQEANRLKDEFLATLSHELRTPLNALLGWSEILRSQVGETEPARRAVESIERNAGAQLVLINDLLDVSRVTTGKLRLARRLVDIGAIVSAAVDAVRPATREKQLETALAIAPVPLDVVGDPDRLQQVVGNVLANAVKFTPPGGRIDVAVERLDGSVALRVQDTGIGIDPALLPFVFERFRQGDSSSTRMHSGLGLGLAIARHLVELHGGTITVESEGAGRGACFRIALPAAAAAGAATSLVRAQPAVRSTLQGVRVLAVDDNRDARDLVKLALERAGARVVTAPSVADALEALERDTPDVVVCDLAMPVRDGYDLLEELQQRYPPLRRPPVIALTAYASADDAQRTLSAGFARHLAKPVAQADLVQAVTDCAPHH